MRAAMRSVSIRFTFLLSPSTELPRAYPKTPKTTVSAGAANGFRIGYYHTLMESA